MNRRLTELVLRSLRSFAAIHRRINLNRGTALLDSRSSHNNTIPQNLCLEPVQKLLRVFDACFLFRPKGPAIQIAMAIGPGIENNQTVKAQRADSSIPNDGP